MSEKLPVPTRFIGLDIHKHYLIAVGVDAQGQELFGPQRVAWRDLRAWATKTLTKQDAVVLEMTTNAFQVHDDLAPYVHSVTLVHPPHVTLITRARVMTDKIAARTLARLHAARLLPPVWVPPVEIRELRALVAHRAKVVRLATQAKNRLHAVLHRHNLTLPEGNPFLPSRRDWWEHLVLPPLEQACTQNNLDTLAFTQCQLAKIEKTCAAWAARQEITTHLVQLPGISLTSAIILWAAIGDIHRFPTAKHLVGYSGLGARVHDSGLTHRSGRITKAGRRDLRATMVEAAQSASLTHPHWKAELARLEPRLGRNKAIVAIARKLLVAVWHVLTKACADCHAQPELVARKMVQFAYRLGKANRPKDQSVGARVREQLDQLGIGSQVSEVPWGQKRPIRLPPSGGTQIEDLTAPFN